MEMLIQRLVRNPHDEEALGYAHQAGQSDPRSYAILLEKVGMATPDPGFAAHWLSESANVWSITVGDAHHAARNFMAAIDKDPTATVPADRLAALYRERNEQKPLVALLEKLVKLLGPLLSSQPDVRGRLLGIHEELGRLWGEPPLGRKDRALENWRRVAELDPQNVFAIYQARELHKELGQLAESLPYFAMEQALADDMERKLALYRDESSVRLRINDGPGASQALRHARALLPDDVGLAQEFGASVVTRVESGEDVPGPEREEARAIFITLAESYDGEYGLGYATSALRCAPGDDRAMQLADHYAKQLGRVEELQPLYAAYVAANPAGFMAAEARLHAGARPPPPAKPAPPSGAVRGPAPAHEPAATRGAIGPAAAQSARASAGSFSGAGAPQPGHLLHEEPSEPQPADENEVRALLDQAQSEAQKGRKPTALAKFREVLRLDPANTEALTWVDEHLRQKRMYSELKEVLLAASRVTSQAPETRKAQLRDVAGLCETQLRDIETAITAAKQIVQLDRGDEQAREQLRRLLEKSQRWDDLATLLEQEAMSAPDVESKIALEKKLAGLHEQKRKDPAAAAEAWARIAALAPADDSAIQTAVKLFEKAEQYQQAADVIAENVSGVEDDTARGNLLGKLGELRRKAGDHGGAGDAYAEAGELTKNGKMWEEAEKAYVEAGRFVEAANAVDQRAKLEEGADAPKKAEFVARAAELYERAQDQGGAIEKLMEACRLVPTSDAYASRLEDLLRAAERFADLSSFLVERAAAIPDKGKRSSVRFAAAAVQREIGDSEAARETLLLVLNDGEDAKALELLIEDAMQRGDHQEHADLLKRLISLVSDKAQKLELSLREASLYADQLDDPRTAIERYEAITNELDPKSRVALHAIADLAEKIGEEPIAAKALEREVLLAEGDERVEIAQRLAQLYEGPLDDPKAAIRALDIVLEADSGDLDATERLLKLCEREEQWDRVAKLLATLLEYEGDEKEASAMTRRLADLYEHKLGKGDEALGVLESLADQGDQPCRDAYIELGDRLGWKGVVATKSLQWTEGAPPAKRHEALRTSFERFMEIGRDKDAAKAALELARAKVADRAIGEKLEEIAKRSKDLDALGMAHEILAKELSGAARAAELVRQAEIMVEAGSDALDAIQHGESALAGVPIAEVEPLLGRLAALTQAPGHVVDLYERQVGRCKSPNDRLAALARATQVAAQKGAHDRAKSFFELALGGGVQEETLEKLEQAARDGDAQTGVGPKSPGCLRRILAEALAAGGQGSRDGGRTRAALLRRAATIANRDLGDVDKAFEWVGDALVTYVDDATLGALDELGAQVGDLRRVEATLARALEEVFDGPLVRKLLSRRARLRRDQLGDRQGAATDLKKLHDLSPADGDVMNELSSLLEQLGDHRGRIQLFEDQILRGRDPNQRAELARRVARLWEEELGDAREAADAWRRVLRMKANDPEATAGLERAKAGKLNHNPTPVVAAVPAAVPPAPLTRPAAPPPSLLDASTPSRLAPEAAPTRLDAVATSAALRQALSTGESDVFKGLPEETADSDEAEAALADLPPRPAGYTDLLAQPTPVVPLDALSGEPLPSPLASSTVPEAAPSAPGMLMSESGELHAAISTRPPTIPPGPRVADDFLGAGPAHGESAAEGWQPSSPEHPAPVDPAQWAAQQAAAGQPAWNDPAAAWAAQGQGYPQEGSQHAGWQQQAEQQAGYAGQAYAGQEYAGQEGQAYPGQAHAGQATSPEGYPGQPYPAEGQYAGHQPPAQGEYGAYPQAGYPAEGWQQQPQHQDAAAAAWAQQAHAHAWAQQHAGAAQPDAAAQPGWAQQQGQYPQVGWDAQQAAQQQAWEQQNAAWQAHQQAAWAAQQGYPEQQQAWGQQAWDPQQQAYTHQPDQPASSGRPPLPSASSVPSSGGSRPPPVPGSKPPLPKSKPPPADDDIEDVDDAELIEEDQ